MKALLLTGYGGIDKYKLSTIPIPEPKDNEVLVRISAIAINNTDVNTRKGAYGDALGNDEQKQTTWAGSTMQFPWIQGCDSCGYIVKVGTNYTNKSKQYIGKRVLINPIINKVDKYGNEYLDKYIGSEIPGTYCEYISVSMENIYIINDNVNLKDYELCTLLCSYITAQGMITNGKIQSNENVIISGATGGCGVALTQLLLLINANPIVIVGNKKKGDILIKAMNTSKNIIVLNRNNWYNQLLSQYPNIEIDAILDVVSGNNNYNNYLKILRVGGRVVTAGAIGGSNVSINIRNVYLKYLSIIGSTTGTKQDFLTLMKFVETNQIKPIIHNKYNGIASIPLAQSEFIKKVHVGKIVVDYNINKSKL